MKRVNKIASVNLTGNVGEITGTHGKRGSQPENAESSAYIRFVQNKTQFTTDDLAVAGVVVVEKPKGKAFAGPFYFDQIELLRETLRGMRKREDHVVAVGESGLWIHRKN